MEQQIKELKTLLESSERILITSHISPDPDAVSSVLLLGTTLMQNYPDKTVVMALEERPTRDLSFLAQYSKIQFESLLRTAMELKPDLLIMVDAMNFERCSRADSKALRASAKDLGVRIVVIDHHEELDIEPSAVYLNKKNPATAQELYEILFYDFEFKKPEGYAQTTLLGIISDTARHKYDNPRHRQTYKVVSELLDAGASIEQLENKTDRYTAEQLKAFAVLAANIKDSGKGYTYAYMDESFMSESMSKEDKMASLKTAAEIFTSQFARNYEANNWGFVVYPELASGPGIYAVSFRSVSGGVDVAALAHKLGGGGHKQAAGAKIQARTVEEAIQKVQQAITSA